VFKMGGRGSSIAWMDNGQVREIRIPTYEVPIVDSTGCGDAYCAGFIVGLSLGWDLEQAGRLGSAAGALVIQGLGSDAGIVDLEKTIEFMNTAKTAPLSD
jgi:sugar/nucleoside kinase (ribokinase family)